MVSPLSGILTAGPRKVVFRQCCRSCGQPAAKFSSGKEQGRNSLHGRAAVYLMAHSRALVTARQGEASPIIRRHCALFETSVSYWRRAHMGFRDLKMEPGTVPHDSYRLWYLMEFSAFSVPGRYYYRYHMI